MISSNYQLKVSDCINEKLVDFCMDEGHSIYGVELLYHHHIQEISKLFYKSEEHYSKILTLAYNKTIKEYKQ